MNETRVITRKRIVLVLGSVLITVISMIGLSASPAAAADGRLCKSVLFTDGANMATPCVFINNSGAPSASQFYAQGVRVWNVGPADGGHTDVINARWYGKNGLICFQQSIMDGYTASGPPCPVQTLENDTNTVWVQLNSSYQNYCRRVFFAADLSISTTSCP